jgi:hypothetical protein
VASAVAKIAYHMGEAAEHLHCWPEEKIESWVNMQCAIFSWLGGQIIDAHKLDRKLTNELSNKLNAAYVKTLEQMASEVEQAVQASGLGDEFEVVGPGDGVHGSNLKH